MPNRPIHHESWEYWGNITLESLIPDVATAIFVGVAGTVIAEDHAGNVASFTAPQGILHIAPKRILTGSGASNLIWLA